MTARRDPIRWGLLPLVMAGGAIGVTMRCLLTFSSDPVLGVQPALFAVNAIGSGLLGLVAGCFGDRPRLRAFLGTGVLGGFTSYSALAPLLSSWSLGLFSATGQGEVVVVMLLLGSLGALLLVVVPVGFAGTGLLAGSRIARWRAGRKRSAGQPSRPVPLRGDGPGEGESG